MGRAKKAEQEEIAGTEEMTALLKEMSILTDRRDALDEMIDARKARLKALMEARGDRVVGDPNYGRAAFSPRRTFKVLDPAGCAKKLTKEILVEGFRPTAVLVDALAARGVQIDGLIGIGVDETFSYTRPVGAAAEERRAIAIQESRRQAEAKIADLLKKM